MSSKAKRVRFAPDHKIIYPPETSISALAVSFIPSSSPTTSKGSSSPYPSKPDSLPGPTPYVFLLTPQRSLRETVNRHACHPFLETSAITYDFRDPIFTATATHNNQRLSIETLRQSAFIPSLSHTTITSSYLPWTIKVYASNAPYITLQDVLSSIHSVLRTNITSTEYRLLPSHHHRERAIRAYQQRYRRLRQKPYSDISNKESESEKRAGMKRVDFLMEHTRFLGISCIGCQPNDEWNLHVASSTMEL
jgi:hypothetical protein